MNDKYKGNKVYRCDPIKNTACNKAMCFINDGPCHLTTHRDYATNAAKQRKIRREQHED